MDVGELAAATAALLRQQVAEAGLTAWPGMASGVAASGAAAAEGGAAPSATRAAGAEGGAAPSTAGLAAAGGGAVPLTAGLAAAGGGAAEAAPLTLDAVRLALGDCQRCKLARTRTTLVFGIGSPRAELMLVGEAPGRDEDLQGEPFVGACGQLLDRMLAAMGLRRSDVYIANLVKCRPPRNRDPEPDEVAACAPALRGEVAAVRPRVIVALGRYAAQAMTGETTAISRLRGKWRAYAGISLMPTFHPSYLLRDPGQKRLVWADLQAVMRRLSALTPGPETVH